MTQYISTEQGNTNTASVRFGDPMPDDQSLPPFIALDHMSKQGQRLDAALSSLIGRLAPYCDDQSIQPAVAELTALPTTDGPSGLERRITREEALLSEMAANVESLISRLRL